MSHQELAPDLGGEGIGEPHAKAAGGGPILWQA